MSIAEFSASMRNRALSAWFANEKAGGSSASASKREAYALENINVLVNPTYTYRAKEQTAEKTSFVITKNTVKDLITTFHNIPNNAPELDELTEVYFSQFKAKNVGVQVSRKKITVGDGIPAVFFPNISFDSITRLVNNIMNIKAGELQKYYEKGHVIGLTTKLLQETSNRISAVDTTGSAGKAFLLEQLDKVIQYYKRLDLASANLKPATDIKLYATYEKRASRSKGAKYLVELQPKSSNQASAKEIQSTLSSIRKLFTPSGLTEAQIEKLITTLQSKVSDPKFQQDLLEMKSSPSFNDMILNVVTDALRGKPDKEYIFGGSNVLIGTKKLPKINTKNIRAEASKKISEATKLKNQVKNAVQRKTYQPKTSLALLQNLLNDSLVQRVKENMGDGNRRDVLNLRTGRFAESVKVERLSQSRAGMITAFYSYMKNPYSTFSEGGRQQYPRTRDPKLLISKSIREIAATQVANRLRAVLV